MFLVTLSSVEISCCSQLVYYPAFVSRFVYSCFRRAADFFYTRVIYRAKERTTVRVSLITVIVDAERFDISCRVASSSRTSRESANLRDDSRDDDDDDDGRTTSPCLWCLYFLLE